MDNSNKIFEDIKRAAHNEEAQEFPSMDKVWLRVENKLDNKVLKKENKLWKKIAIAASLLLIFTISYQVFNPVKEISIPTPVIPAADSITSHPPTTIATTDAQNEMATIPVKPVNPSVKSHPQQILEQQIKSTEQITATEEAAPESVPETDLIEEIKPVPATTAEAKKEFVQSAKSSNFRKRQAFEARRVRRDEQYNANADFSTQAREAKTVATKSAPLLVVDGKAVTGKDDRQTLSDGLSKINPQDLDEIVFLQEPLYIINGIHYSEQQLFGPNPTSPYHPLNQQEIETLSILQGEKAAAAYGKKGEKGVVIITTKNGKPVKIPVQKD